MKTNQQIYEEKMKQASTDYYNRLKDLNIRYGTPRSLSKSLAIIAMAVGPWLIGLVKILMWLIALV